VTGLRHRRRKHSILTCQHLVFATARKRWLLQLEVMCASAWLVPGTELLRLNFRKRPGILALYRALRRSLSRIRSCWLLRRGSTCSRKSEEQKKMLRARTLRFVLLFYIMIAPSSDQATAGGRFGFGGDPSQVAQSCNPQISPSRCSAFSRLFCPRRFQQYHRLKAFCVQRLLVLLALLQRPKRLPRAIMTYLQLRNSPRTEWRRL